MSEDGNETCGLLQYRMGQIEGRMNEMSGKMEEMRVAQVEQERRRMLRQISMMTGLLMFIAAIASDQLKALLFGVGK